MRPLIHIETFSDSRLVLEMIGACLSDQPDFHIVAEWNLLPHPAVTGDPLPDVLIVFLRNPDATAHAVSWAAERMALLPLTQLVLITGTPGKHVRLIPPDLTARFTLLAIEELLTTTMLFNTIRRVASLPLPLARDRDFSPISPRQADILALIAKGFSNQVIAESLHVSEKTVENQINLLYHKLGISHRDPEINARVMATNLAGMVLPSALEHQGA